MEQTTLTVRSLTASARADDDKRERQLTTRPPFYDIISRARVVIIIRLHATRGGRNRWIIGGSETGACAGCGGGGGGGGAGDDRSRSRAIRRALPVLPARRRAPATPPRAPACVARKRRYWNRNCGTRTRKLFRSGQCPRRTENVSRRPVGRRGVRWVRTFMVLRLAAWRSG